MSTYDTTAKESTDTDTTSASTQVNKRDVKALTEVMTVLGDQGRVKDADGLYEVVTQSGGTYLVDAHERACECPDAECRNPTGGCKHVRRVAFATGAQAIPAWADAEAIDDDLGAFVSGSPRFEGEDENTEENDEDEDASPIKAHTPNSDGEKAPAVAADGGQLIDVDADAGAATGDTDDRDDDIERTEETTTETDHWGQRVRRYDAPCYGAGERGECQRCGSHHLMLVAATAPPETGSSDRFEEFYECDCGATGSFQLTTRRDGARTRRWTGPIRYPEA